VLSLCYKAKSDKLDVPVTTTHFTGAYVLLYASSTFVKVVDGVVCFAFVPTQSTPIFEYSDYLLTFIHLSHENNVTLYVSSFCFTVSL